jgi:hypothetical protein
MLNLRVVTWLRWIGLSRRKGQNQQTNGDNNFSHKYLLFFFCLTETCLPYRAPNNKVKKKSHLILFFHVSFAFVSRPEPFPLTWPKPCPGIS